MSTAPTPDRALTVLGALLVVTGAPLALLAVAAPDLLVTVYSIAATAGTPTDGGPAMRLGAAISGALTLGWGVLLGLLGRGLPLRSAALASAVAWYVLDSGASLVLGFGWNALSNTGFLAAFVLLLWPRRSSVAGTAARSGA